MTFRRLVAAAAAAASLTVPATASAAVSHVGSCVIAPSTSCPGANLAGADLTGADLSRANLVGANLHGANLNGANLTQANLAAADVSSVLVQRANLERVNLEGARLNGSQVDLSNLRYASLKGATLRATNFAGSTLNHAILTSADAQGANFYGAHLLGAHLSHADIRDASFHGAHFQGTHMNQTTWTAAKLWPSNFSSDSTAVNGLYREIHMHLDAYGTWGWCGPNAGAYAPLAGWFSGNADGFCSATGQAPASHEFVGAVQWSWSPKLVVFKPKDKPTIVLKAERSSNFGALKVTAVNGINGVGVTQTGTHQPDGKPGGSLAGNLVDRSGFLTAGTWAYTYMIRGWLPRQDGQ